MTTTNLLDIETAARALRAGKLVAFPTETVYGLGGNALDDHAIAAIYAAKGRPLFNPLIVHVASLEEAQRHAEFTPTARLLAQRFWPGPLTLVLRRRADCLVSLLASAGLETIALRVPAHPLALALLAGAGIPVAAPSANRSGRISPTCAAHVREDLAAATTLILDGGDCAIGIESTVVDASGKTLTLLRPGGVTLEQLQGTAGPIALLDKHANGSLHSPGMLASHYAPSLPMRLDIRALKEGEALLAFGPIFPPGARAMEQLSEKGDLREAAANVFRMLRRLDKPEFSAIAVMPIPHDGLGLAINDRLSRAAARG